MMTNEVKTARCESSWRQQPLAWMVFGIPAVSVLLGLVMLALSIYSYDGLVVDDYYKQGLQINRSLARDRAAAELALTATVALDREAGRASLKLSGNDGFVPLDTVTLSLFHTTRGGSDQRLTLRRTGPLEYDGVLPELIPGNWHTELSAGEWRLIGRLHDSDDELSFGHWTKP